MCVYRHNHTITKLVAMTTRCQNEAMAAVYSGAVATTDDPLVALLVVITRTTTDTTNPNWFWIATNPRPVGYEYDIAHHPYLTNTNQSNNKNMKLMIRYGTGSAAGCVQRMYEYVTLVMSSRDWCREADDDHPCTPSPRLEWPPSSSWCMDVVRMGVGTGASAFFKVIVILCSLDQIRNNDSHNVILIMSIMSQQKDDQFHS